MLALPSPYGAPAVPLTITDGEEQQQQPKKIPKVKIIIGAVILAFSILGVVLLIILLRGDEDSGDDLNKKDEIVYEQVTESDLVKDNGANCKFNPRTFEEQVRQETFVEAELLTTKWEDIAGNESAKNALIEGLVWPMQNPTIFKGARLPPRGVLLFGPPGTGKTMLARAVASNLKIAFFNASGTTFTAKYFGESERLLKALFKLARSKPVAVIFLDEVDSFLGARGQREETDATRRVKTEFMVQMDGLATDHGRVMVIAATNRPQDLDDAIIRRFTKRIKVGLPDMAARATLLSTCLGAEVSHNLNSNDWTRVAELFEGRHASGSDLMAFCKYAAMQPIRKLKKEGKNISTITFEQIPPVVVQDFADAMQVSKPSIQKENVEALDVWESKYSSL